MVTMLHNSVFVTSISNNISSTTDMNIFNQSSTIMPALTQISNTSTSLITTISTTDASANKTDENGCLWILYGNIGSSNVRIWDVLLLIPNLIFLLFVIYRIRRVWHRILSGIGSGGSPIFITYFILVALAAFLGVVRGVVSMTVDVSSLSGSDANKILWVILRFFLLMVELSVLVFGIAFGRLDSKASVKWVLIVTTTIAFIYSSIQCTLELVVNDEHFHVKQSNRSVYGHGGTWFCFVTSAMFLSLYVGVLALPYMKFMQKHLSVPTRKSFYMYIMFMALLYFTSTVGCAILLFWNLIGVCLLDAYSVAYFTMFAPLIYWAFLSSYFGNTQPSSMLFSYATHVDEGLADISDYDYPGNGITVDSTLSGILVFNQGADLSLQRASTRALSMSSVDDSSVTLPSSDSTHSFIRNSR